jgi:type I restriction enzyme, R subunit
MPVDHTEKGFEQAIEDHLLNHGYRKGNPTDCVASLSLDTRMLVEFLFTTQRDEWQRLRGIHGDDTTQRIVEAIASNLAKRGMLDCLRHGVIDRGVKLRLAYFRPATRMNAETMALYDKNILSITRQVHYSEKMRSLSIDVVLSLSGLPVATAELMNPFAGKTVDHARKQYRYDRDAREPLFRFKERALVHFAVAPQKVLC